MSRGKVVAIIILFLISASAIWYLFVKDYNYRIRFETSQPPGAVYSSLVDWKNLNKSEVDTIIIDDKVPFEEVSFTLYKSDSIFKYNWEIERKNDSTTEVFAYIKDKENSFKQNLAVPFGKNEFVNSNIVEVQKVMQYLKDLENLYNFKIEEDTIFTIEPIFCAYVPISSTITGKAAAMYENIAKVMGYIKNNELNLDGDPFLTINSLEIQNNTIEFDFCFPVDNQDSLPPSQQVKFKTMPKINAIKAIYNGNYRSTEYAWFELIDYARRNNLEYLPNPIEIYKNDPQSGTNADEWIAEVYLPIKE